MPLAAERVDKTLAQSSPVMTTIIAVFNCRLQIWDQADRRMAAILGQVAAHGRNLLLGLEFHP